MEARAKVNLFLRVLGRRPDGYHDLETLIVPISLADRLKVNASAVAAEVSALSLSLDLLGDPALLAGVPADESNLVLRAASTLAAEAGVTGFAEIELEKLIPVAAGLGGGSADAAAVILALNDLWDLGLPDRALLEIAAAVGSDVPALLAGGGVLARGRGERIEKVEVPRYEWAIVAFPFGVSTAQAFGWWDEDEASTGPDPAAVTAAARSGDPSVLGPLLFNDLEAPVTLRHREVRDAKESLMGGGAAGAVMCGSGPTVAGLMPAGTRVGVPGATYVTSG